MHAERARRPRPAGHGTCSSLPRMIRSVVVHSGLALALLAVGCSFDTSGAPAAGSGSDDGGAVAGDDGGAVERFDGAPGAADASVAMFDAADPVAVCLALCPGDCNEVGDCAVACGNGECEERQVCPPGVACHVLCAADGTCGGGVDCTASSSCIIECNGDDSCAGSLDCGPGECDITCGGNSSCGGGIDCSTSCNCDVSCTGGSGPCEPAADCPAGCGDDPGCTNSGDSCNPTC